MFGGRRMSRSDSCLIQLAVISENGMDPPVSTYMFRLRLCSGQRGNVIDRTLDVPIGLPKVNRALGIQPELGAIAE